MLCPASGAGTDCQAKGHPVWPPKEPCAAQKQKPEHPAQTPVSHDSNEACSPALASHPQNAVPESLKPCDSAGLIRTKRSKLRVLFLEGIHFPVGSLRVYGGCSMGRCVPFAFQTSLASLSLSHSTPSASCLPEWGTIYGLLPTASAPPEAAATMVSAFGHWRATSQAAAAASCDWHGLAQVGAKGQHFEVVNGYPSLVSQWLV